MSYKTKAQVFHQAVSAYDQAQVVAMIREDYIQHNPKVPTGREAFISFLAKLKEHQTKIINIRILEEGSYICMHHLWKNAIPFGARETAAFHVIRFDACGLIAEHWNVMQECTRPNPAGRSLVDGETHNRDLKSSETNKAKAKEMLAAFIAAKPQGLAKIMPLFFHPEFHQHHPDIGDGIEQFAAAEQSGIINPSYKRLHKVFAEGEFVLSVAEGKLGEKPTAFYDLFRFKDGLIKEHWNIYQTIPTTDLANSNTMFNF